MFDAVKKWALVALILLSLSACSWRQVWNWFDEMEWERDDEVIRIVDFIVR